MKRKSRNYRRAQVALADLLGAARHYGIHHSTVNSQFSALREQFNLTLREWAFLEGYRTAVVDAWYNSALVFRYRLDGGRLVDYANASRGDRDAINAGKQTASGHYWSHNMRTFFESAS